MRPCLRTRVDRRKQCPARVLSSGQAVGQLLWFESGEVEYRFSLGEIDPVQVEWLEISMELSSNAPMYRENFKSDIYVGLGETELGVWTSPGDYGARRGRFNPSWWSDTSSQYGLLKTWRVDNQGCTLDGEPLSSVTLADLNLGGRIIWRCASACTRTRRTSAASTCSANNSAILRRASSCAWAMPSLEPSKTIQTSKTSRFVRLRLEAQNKSGGFLNLYSTSLVLRQPTELSSSST